MSKRLSNVEKAELVVIMWAALCAAVVGTLLWLEAGKDAHQEAGLHEPAPAEVCYELPGQGELVTLGTLTFCVTH